MKVLFWTNRFYPVIGGVQVVAVPLIHALRALGHEIVVVTSRNDADQDDLVWHEEIPVHRFNFRAALDANDLAWILSERRRVAAFLREFTPDLIHVFGFGVTDVFYVQTRAAHNAPALVTLQGEDSLFLEQLGRETILYRMLEQAAWVTSVTQLEIERLRNLIPALTQHSSCIYNSLAPPELEPAPLPEQPLLLTLGRLSPEKSFDLAIRAFALIAPRYPHARLQIVGDGEERPALERLACSLGLTHQVEFAGWVLPPLVPGYINRATAVVLSSQTEGLPLAGIQTAQMARPLIAPRVGGIPELVIDGETGLLSNPNDAADMARCMEQLITSRDRAAALGHAAKKRVEAHFAFEQIVDQYRELYERLPKSDRGH